MTTETALNVAIAERDRILTAMDVDSAKAFIAKHGGHVPRQRRFDWERVLHLARFEASSMPEDVWWESRIWLARHLGKSLGGLPERGPYARATVDLLFPRDLTESYIAEQIGEHTA